MDKIANWLKAYIDAHPFDPGDSDCETVLKQLYQAYAEPHESGPMEISNGFKGKTPAEVRTEALTSDSPKQYPILENKRIQKYKSRFAV